MARKIIKLSKDVASRMLSKKSLKILSCKQCSTEVRVDFDTVMVLCPMCTCQLVPFTTKIHVEKSDRPKGWAFMAEFVDKDGNVFHKGTEIPELKGTLKPTNVEKIKKEQKDKSQKNKLSKNEREKKKEEKLVKEYEKKKQQQKKDKEKKEKEAAKALRKSSAESKLNKFI